MLDKLTTKNTMALDVGRDLLSLAAVDYSSTSFNQKSKSDSTLGSTTTTDFQSESIKNKTSTIKAGGNLDITVKNTLLIRFSE